MIVQAKIKLFIPCTSCTEGNWQASHLPVGFKTKWTCQVCRTQSNIERLDENNFEVVPTGRKDTPITVTLQSITEPKITLKLNAWRCAHSQNESDEDLRSSEQYFYNEQTCPTNWVSQIVQMEFQGDTDPHGVFEFVSVKPGHLSDEDMGIF
jgi:hypothetical protein